MVTQAIGHRLAQPRKPLGCFGCTKLTLWAKPSHRNSFGLNVTKSGFKDY